MHARLVRIELLLGTLVTDATGRRVGRIEEFRAVRRGGDMVILEYVMGVAGLFERLAAWGVGRFIARAFGIRPRGPTVIPWHALDLSEPQRPRLLVDVDELRARRAAARRSHAS